MSTHLQRMWKKSWVEYDDGLWKTVVHTLRSSAERTRAEGGRKGCAPAQGEEGSLICRVTSGSPAICLVRAETGSPSVWSLREESRVGADCTVPCLPSRAGLL